MCAKAGRKAPCKAVGTRVQARTRTRTRTRESALLCLHSNIHEPRALYLNFVIFRRSSTAPLVVEARRARSMRSLLYFGFRAFHCKMPCNALQGKANETNASCAPSRRRKTRLRKSPVLKTRIWSKTSRILPEECLFIISFGSLPMQKCICRHLQAQDKSHSHSHSRGFPRSYDL